MSKCVFAAVSAAVGLCVVASSAAAQDASATTAGGDVTADEATPLPPVVVQAPSEPITHRRKATTQATTSPAAIAGSGDTALAGTTDAEGPAIGAFTLGQIDMIGGSTITSEAVWTFNKVSLPEAVDLAPGVSSHSAGGRRNEGDIFVRGFDRLRVPLSIDGVRIYLPADNRIDMNRFLTPDLAEIQIQKGYVSVLNGPGGMAGAINIVSRKPIKEFEFEARSGLVMNGDVSDMNQWSSYAYAGTRQKGYYAQISGTIVDQDHFNLSEDFRPTQPGSLGYDPSFPYEQGGDRDYSDFNDWKINAKVGITPNATDEYSINFTTQSGEKNAPLHVKKERLASNPNSAQRYWNWPYYDISSVSWLSKTQLGETSYFKSNVYYNTFENRLSSFDVPTLTPIVVPPYSQQTFPYAFDSDYEDYAYGGFLEFGTELIPMNTTKATIHYRRDNHSERNFARPDHPTASYVEPWQYNIEDTWSFAGENTFHATKRLDIVAGLSYDYLDVKEAEDYVGAVGNPGSPTYVPAFIRQNDITTNDAWNWQGAAIYSYSETGKTHFSVSDRARFATVFERYSTRFDTVTPNPYLEPERARNFEIGFSDIIFDQAKVSGAVFYTDLKDSIQFVTKRVQNPATLAWDYNSGYENVDGEHYGVEVSVDWDIAPGIRIGGNYTYLERDIAFDTAGARAEGTPRHQAFLYLAWSPIDALTITPSLELASDRYAVVTSEPLPTGGPFVARYIQTGSYALVNVQAEYKFNENFSAAIGGTNLTDENYELAEGFPEAGRQFFANARMKF